MASGIKPDESCVLAYNELKMHHKHAYVLFKIENQNKIIVDKCANKDATYEDFLNDLQERRDDGCYAIVDYRCEGVPGSTLFFVPWVPESLTVRKKMLYASSKDALRKIFEGVKGEVQAGDLCDVCTEEMTRRAKLLCKVNA